MTGTFGSLNIAKTGLQYQQIAIDVADNNIANVNTDGYVRRRANAAEVGGPDQPVMWSTYTGNGEGVTTTGVQRLTDILLDKRVRSEHANLSYLQVQQTSLERVESAVDEPSDNGVSAALASFSSAWEDVVTSPDGSAARQTVVADGQSLAAAINTQARSLDSEMDEQRAGALQDVQDINQDAQQMAQLNHAIFVAQANGADVGALQDQRDQVALDLANKAGAVSTVDATTGKLNVTIDNGTGSPISLVTGDSYGAIVQTGINADGTTNAAPDATSTVSFGVTALVSYDATTAPDPATATAVAPNGDLGGVQALLNVTLPNYRKQLNDLAKNIATVVNTQSAQGFDQSGQAGQAFFTFGADGSSTDYAGSLMVSDKVAADPTLVAAAATSSQDTAGNVIGNNDATNADRISQALKGGPLVTGDPATPVTGVVDASGAPVTSIDVSDQYQRMIAGLGTTAAGLNTQMTNQQLLTSQVDDEREQSAGVSLDEETINLMQAQRGYQAASRVLNVMDSILDTLINHTGVSA